MQAILRVACFQRRGAPRCAHVGRPCRVDTDQRALPGPASRIHYLMDSNSDVRRHGICHPQNVFADGCPIRRFERAQGRLVVCLAHVRRQFGILHELLELLPIV